MSRIDSEGSAVVVTDPDKPLAVELQNETGDPIDVEIANTDPLEVVFAESLKTAVTLKECTPPLSTDAYSDGDVLFIPVAVSIASANAGHALLHSISIIDKGDIGGAFDLIFLSGTATSFGAANAPLAIDDTDAAKILGVVPVTAQDYYDLGGCKVASLRNIGMMLKAESTGLNVYVAGVSKDTKTYAATGLTFRLGMTALD